MSNSTFWRCSAVMFIAALFFIGSGVQKVMTPQHSTPLHPTLQIPTLTNTAFAGVGVADENSEVVFTASQDGRKIYMWQYFSSKPPKFIGEAEAILRQ